MYITQDTGDTFVDVSASDRMQLNANLANKLRNEDNTLLSIGKAKRPVYFTNGIPVECDTSLDVNISGSADKVNIKENNSTTLYILGTTNIGEQEVYQETDVMIQDGVLYGAAWNDYAEYRESKEAIKPGHVVCETGKGDLVLSSKRLQPGANIVSDTFGFAIGQNDKCKTPIAVSGRALVYTYEDRNTFAAGDPVCAGPDGKVSLMSRVEVQEYPDRMIGTVSEIPDYDTWGEGNVPVDGRIWIKVI